MKMVKRGGYKTDLKAKRSQQLVLDQLDKRLLCSIAIKRCWYIISPALLISSLRTEVFFNLWLIVADSVSSEGESEGGGGEIQQELKEGEMKAGPLCRGVR